MPGPTKLEAAEDAVDAALLDLVKKISVLAKLLPANLTEDQRDDMEGWADLLTSEAGRLKTLAMVATPSR